MAEGKLIVIEGGDASGKATQSLKLAERLGRDGHVVESLSFPQYDETIAGGLIRECLDGRRGDFMNIDPKIASMLYAVDRYETKDKLMQWLYDGAVVILDRYVSSNMLHQGAKIADDETRHELVQWIYKLEHEQLGLPQPDLMAYLHVPALKRATLLQSHWAERGWKLDVAEVDIVHQEMVDRYNEGVFNVYPNTLKVECVKDDELRTPEDIHDEIYEAAQALMK